MNLTVEVDARELRAAFAKAPAKVSHGLNTWVTKTTFMTERHAKTAVQPHVDTGQLQSSIRSQVGNLKGEVKPTAKHAIFVHEGRRPGRMPPYQARTPLNRWATKRGMNPFLVARAIARKGTKKHPFMVTAYNEVKPRAERDGQRALHDIVRSI